MVGLIPWRTRGRESSMLRSPVWRLRDEMDRLFDRVFESPWFPEITPMAMWSPPIEVVDDEKEITLTAELPGIDPDQIDISVLGNTLTISGEKQEKRERREGETYLSERCYGSFRRSIELPSAVESEKVSAEYDNGVLKVHIPKSEALQPKRIQVRASSGGRARIAGRNDGGNQQSEQGSARQAASPVPQGQQQGSR